MTSYNLDRLRPIGNIDQFPKNIPVALITSEVNVEVPAVCTKTLAEALRKHGNNSVHLPILKKIKTSKTYD